MQWNKIWCICYSKSVKPGITRNPWSFQWLHEISIIIRDFMKSLFISSNYMKSLKKQALNFILLLVNWLFIWNLFMESHAILRPKAQLNVQMETYQRHGCCMDFWKRVSRLDNWNQIYSVPTIQGSCVHRIYLWFFFFLLYPTLTYFPVRGLALGGLSVWTSTSKETVGRQEWGTQKRKEKRDKKNHSSNIYVYT